jgi:hypothetical protein
LHPRAKTKRSIKFLNCSGHTKKLPFQAIAGNKMGGLRASRAAGGFREYLPGAFFDPIESKKALARTSPQGSTIGRLSKALT